MASSFFALLDDITAILDDVATMTKVATKKTAGVLGDDLAVNADQVSGVSAERELPVVWAVTKGSLLNKVILVPLALLLSAFFPVAINYVLLIGGAYLCFEAAEKVWEWLAHRHEKQSQISHKVAHHQTQDLIALEKSKIRGAIKTDFILSAEIVVIALGELTAMGKPFLDQVIALIVIAIVLTIGVYGMVALIVKMDDIGYHWQRQSRGILATLGRGLLWFAPKLLRSLTLIGTLAMFAVGGNIWIERMAWLHHHLHPVVEQAHHYLGIIGSYGIEIMFGVVIGFIVLMLIAPLHHFSRKPHD